VLLPQARAIGVLVNRKSPEVAPQLEEIEAAARTIGRPLRIGEASSDAEFAPAFASLAAGGVDALVVSNDAFFNGRRERIVALAEQHRLPTLYDRREYAVAGGLMSYGTSYAAAYREIGLYAGRILKGTKPADLPIEQATRFELVINLKTASALGLSIPDRLLALADEVIE
jgi:putative ABC transport system substrate-binding protein